MTFTRPMASAAHDRDAARPDQIDAEQLITVPDQHDEALARHRRQRALHFDDVNCQTAVHPRFAPGAGPPHTRADCRRTCGRSADRESVCTPRYALDARLY
ncbi:MAG: hypothetical protein ABIS45_16485 [Burkholderiales bacterium]